MAKAMKEHKVLYLLMVPGLLYFVLFRYLPMFGLVIAFKDYNIFKGIWASDWVGLVNFEALVHSSDFWNVMKNTLVISLTKILIGFPIPILLAILLNDIKSMRFKRVTQTFLYLPHFLSWVVIGGIMLNLFSPVFGLAGEVFRTLGIEPVNIMAKKGSIFWVVIFSDVWKEAGWSTIVFLAALTQVDESLYEAAKMDGANKFKQMLHITLPCISSIVIVMLILRIGKVMNAGFEQILVLQNPITMESIDIFDTYVYREGLGRGSYSFAAAVDTFKSVIALILVTSANKISKMFGEEGIV
ncbi:ABC transporter permease subunit [Hungatella sp.]|jgi:putative aldouronate transport system permease protein|uniref:ABC transporter permease n=1 Tax=Hungatella sp. TaxID=2613924 RepID=UPI002A83CF66|nr:ABC transporter permease subunit [Hungatella sp.]